MPPREPLHCNFCRNNSMHVMASGCAVGFCPHCGSNNLVNIKGEFVGPPQDAVDFDRGFNDYE